jgi:hypothetical protein
MRLQASPPRREGDLVLGCDVPLPADADHLVFEQGVVEQREHGVVDLDGQVGAGDERSERAGLALDGDPGGRLGEGSGHHIPPSEG